MMNCVMTGRSALPVITHHSSFIISSCHFSVTTFDLPPPTA
jgi:hypothetical protein